MDFINDTFYFYKGRVALYATLKAMGINKDDEIVLPGFTCVVVPNAIIYCGAKPVYVDIERETFNINPDLIEVKITPKTKVIIAQHTFGIPAKMDRILEIAKKYNLYVIEDSCHAIGSKYNGQEVGSFGDAAFFSSQWSKPVSTGFGGWVKINNFQLITKMKEIYNQFKNPSIKDEMEILFQNFLYKLLITPKTYLFIKKIYFYLYSKGIIKGSSSPEELNCKLPSNYEMKMGKIQKLLLNINLNRIDKIIEKRKKIVKIYEEYLPKLNLPLVKLYNNYEIVFLRYPILVDNKENSLRYAQKLGIEVGDWFVSPIHPNLENWEFVHYKKGSCPIAEEICEKIINLPTNNLISFKKLKKLLDYSTERLLIN